MMVVAVMAEALHLFPSYGKIALVSNLSLLPPCGQAENGTVRVKIRSAALTIALLAVCMSATAQYHDRDSNGAPKTSATAPAPEARVDINHASVDELLKVPGMTPTWAGRIVRFRPYRTKQDLLDHGVVTSEVYDRIKDYVIAHRDKE